MQIASKPLLVTSSILDSFAWLSNCPPNWKEKALEEFNNSLKRIYTPLSPAVKRGMDFEDRICRDLYVSRDIFEKKHGMVTMEFYDLCKGGTQQAVLKKTITVDDQPYVLYGKADIFFPEIIYDIKTTGRFKGFQAYTERAQHLMYQTASGIPAFKYLVAVGSDKQVPVERGGKSFMEEQWCVDSVIPIDVTMDPKEAQERLEDRIRVFIKFIAADKGMLADYVNIFTR